MPITATAQGKKFTFPDGTPPEQMGAAIDEFFSNQQQAPEQPAQQAVQQQPAEREFSSPRNRRAAMLREERERAQSLFQQFEAGEISSQDLTPSEVEQVRRARIDAIPEITGSFSQLSENLGFKEALAGLTAFDPDEFGRILQAADPNIGVVTTPEGERIAINRQTDEAFSINKTGPSLIDAVQFAGSAAALTPSGFAGGVLRQAGAAAGTQAALEAGQAAAGGEFDVAPVVLAGAAVPATAAALKGVQSGISKLRSNLNISAPTQQATTTGQQATAQAVDRPPLSLEPIDDVAPRKFHPLFGQESKNTTIIREALERGEGDKVAAGYVLDGSKKVVADPLARNVMKQGKEFGTFDPGKVALFSGSSKADKKAFGQMLDIVEAGMKNAKVAAERRPGQVVGDSLLKRYKHVQQVNRTAGRDVGKAAKALKGEDVDLTQAKAGFLDSLDATGVGVGAKGKLDFRGSTFEGDPGTEKLVSDLWKRLLSIEKSRDGLHIHRAKKFIDNKVDVGQRSASPITTDAERIALDLRSSINNSLRNASDEYRVANEIFSETIEPLKEFQRLSGRNFNPESANANEFVGKLSRRILSNVQSREPLIDVIHALENVGRKHGGKFNDDIATQIMFVEQLEKTFGTFAPTGIQGEIGKGVGRALRGDKTQVLIDATGKLIDKARGVSEDAALKSLREFVKKGAKK